MLSSQLEHPIPTSDQLRTMSYAFGPHMQGSETGIYFGGDNRVVRCPVDKIPLPQLSPPAWLVADWMMADSRGEPISDYARSFVVNPTCWNSATAWLHEFLIVR
mgnify:FL=1